MNEEKTIATIDDSPLVTQRDPEIVLAEAQRAAAALQKVVAGKKKPVIMNNEQYLEFEDWQTIARFYGITADIEWTRFVEFGPAQGFEARAHAIMAATGQVVSSAEAMCLNDEPNWKAKPLFQLRSMAQTRAAAKVLRNVLAWVVVLAGYRPTPAEEIQDMVTGTVKVQPNPSAIIPPAAIITDLSPTPSTGASTTPVGSPEPEPEKDRKGWERELYQTAIQCGFVAGKDDQGRDKVDFDTLGHWLKDTANLSTGYVKKLSVDEIKLAIGKLVEQIAAAVNERTDQLEANGDLGAAANRLFDRFQQP